MANRGINGGIDGIISLTEETIPSAAGTIVFNAKVNSYTGNIAARPILRTGPGSNGIPKIRLADIRGGGSADGEFTWNGPPLPSTIQYATGSITYQVDDGCTISFAVKVSSVSFNHVEQGKGQDELFHCEFKWEMVGAVTVAWANGTPVTVSAPGANDSPTYEGRAKSLDPQGIKSTATTRTDCEGIADDDVTQTAKIAALIGAASAPMTNLKPISISCTQYEDDHNGIQVVTQFALQDSKDEIETPRNVITTDPNDITSETMLAKVFTTGSPPSDPSPPTNQKIVQRIDTKINDQLSFRLYRWGKKDSIDDLEIPATFTVADTNNMASYASVGKVDGTPSTPAGFVLRTSKTQFVVSPTLGITHTMTTNEFGLRDTFADVQMPGTWSRIDPSDLESEGIKTQMYVTAGGVPASPTPPSGLQIVASRTTQENTVNSKAEWWFGKDTSIQKWVNAHSETLTDPSNVASTQTTAAVDTTPPALSAGFVDRGVRLITITHDHTGQVREGGLKSTADDHTMGATYSFRSAMSPYRDAVASVINSTTTDKLEADAQFATFQSVANAFGLSVHSINRQEKLLVLEYQNPGVRLIGSSVGGYRFLPALLRSGNIQVYIPFVKAVSSGVYIVKHRSSKIQGYPVRKFTVVRLVSGTVLPDFAALEGLVNAGSFHGALAQTVQYIGAEFDVNTGLSGTYNFLMYYHFVQDAAGIFNYQGERDDTFFTSTAATVGWNNVSAFTDNTIQVDVPGTADLSPIWP